MLMLQSPHMKPFTIHQRYSLAFSLGVTPCLPAFSTRMLEKICFEYIYNGPIPSLVSLGISTDIEHMP